MRNWFRKYRPPLLISAIVLSFVLSFAVLVQIFKSTNCLAAWLFNFINDWAIILYASITFLLAIAAFWGIREGRRGRIEERHRQALERIRSWAEECFDALSRPRTVSQLASYLKELKIKLQPIHVRTPGILFDAEQLGGDLDTKVKTGYIALSKFVAMLGTERDIAKLKEYFDRTDFGELKPISTEGELAEVKKEVMTHLNSIIESATGRLVPPLE